MRETAAHHAGVGLDGDRVHAHAFEEFLVGLLHREVALHRAVVGRVEGIRVHHDELARTHQPVARADLVAELRGDLVEILRQIAVAGDLRLHERGDDLFVSRPEDELRLFRAALAGAGAVGAKHDFTRRRPTRTLLPKLGRMHMRHPSSMRARARPFPRGKSA